MASRCRPREVTSPRSLKPIQGIPLQGSLYMDDLPMECLHFEESYAHFMPLFKIVMSRLSIQSTFMSFRILLSPPSFVSYNIPIASASSHLRFRLLLKTYISIIDFTKSPWVFYTFFTHSFYPSSYRTQIRRSTTRFIYVIVNRKQFDIAQVILDTMTPYHNHSYLFGAFSFTLMITHLLEDIGFELDPSHTAQMSLVLINGLAPHATKAQEVSQEAAQKALIEENNIKSMKQDAPILDTNFLELTQHTHFNKSHQRPSPSSAQASTSTNLTPRKLLDLMTSLYLRMDTQDQAIVDQGTQLRKIQGQLMSIIS
ncbi:hypothetical protein AAG906_035356 [Vitis piasezkii]